MNGKEKRLLHVWAWQVRPGWQYADRAKYLFWGTDRWPFRAYRPALRTVTGIAGRIRGGWTGSFWSLARTGGGMGRTGGKDPCHWQSHWVCEDTRSYAYREPVGSYGLREAHQQPRLPNALPHIREYPVWQGKREIHSLFVDAFMEYLHQQPPQLRTGKNRRTGKESLCRQGSYGKISEWAYQSLSAFIHRGIAAYPARVCRAFQSKRAAFTGLCYRGRGTGAAYRWKSSPHHSRAATGHRTEKGAWNHKRAVFNSYRQPQPLWNRQTGRRVASHADHNRAASCGYGKRRHYRRQSAGFFHQRVFFYGGLPLWLAAFRYPKRKHGRAELFWKTSGNAEWRGQG